MRIAETRCGRAWLMKGKQTSISRSSSGARFDRSLGTRASRHTRASRTEVLGGTNSKVSRTR